MPWQIITILEEEMNKPIWTQNCTPAFIEMTRKFVSEKIAKKLANIRKNNGMLPGLAVPDEDFMDIDIDEDVEGKQKEGINQDLKGRRKTRNILKPFFSLLQRIQRLLFEICLL